MKYQKPEIVRMGPAIEAVQSMGKPHGDLDVADRQNPIPSVTTYESDE
jgi:hypothetical protein